MSGDETIAVEPTCAYGWADDRSAVDEHEHACLRRAGHERLGVHICECGATADV